jgi:gliding motility-associated-like protein
MGRKLFKKKLNFPLALESCLLIYILVLDMISTQPARLLLFILFFLEMNLVFGQTLKTSNAVRPMYSASVSSISGYKSKANKAVASGGTKINVAPNNRSTIPAAPNINYQTPKSYVINNLITSLVPTNTGGAVPATIYGQVSTYAGTGSGFQNGPSLSSRFSQITAVGVDDAGNVFVDDWANNTIREISTAGIVTTFAGSPGNSGAVNGQGTAASFYEPDGLVIDAAGNVYIGDQGNNLIRKITPAGVVTTFAGSGLAGATDGIATAASFNNPRALAIDGAGNMYVADQANNLIRKITSAGVVTTFAGSGAGGFVDGTGRSASFNVPTGVGVDASGSVYVADAGNNAIRKITPAGVVTTFAGNGSAGSINGTGKAANFNFPREIRADVYGNFYVTDANNNLIRKVTAGGVVTTLAGSGAAGASDGVGKVASFNYPLGITLDNNGNVYVGDNVNNLVRKIIITGYTIDKQLPSGLTFDPTTGIITGTPTALSPATDYTIIAYNAGGSSSTIVNIQVVTLKPSIITFPAITNPAIDANNNIIPGATSTNNETPIVYTSSNTAVATVTANGLIHLVGPGVTVITATQSGNANYSTAVPATEILTVMESQIIQFPAIAAKTTCDADFSAGALSSNPIIPLSYASSNTSVATISSQGIIHIVGTGSTTITITQSGNSLFTPAPPQTQLLTVTSPIAITVSIVADNVSPCAGGSVTFTTNISNGGTNPTYQWQVNGINAGTNGTSFTTSALNQTDFVQCIVTNNDLCKTTVRSNVISGIKYIPFITPGVTITSSVTGAVCVGSAIVFTAIPTNGGNSPNYQWQVNGKNVSINSFQFGSNSFADGDIVTCILTNSSSPCLNASQALSNSLKVSLIGVSNVVPSVVVTPDAFGSCVGLSVTYTAKTTNAGSSPAYQWHVNGQNAGTNDSTFTSSALQTGDKITCTITVRNACSVATATSQQATITASPLFTDVVTISSSAVNNIISANQQVSFTCKAADTTDIIYQWQINGIAAGTNSRVFITSNLANGDVVTCVVAISGQCLAALNFTSNALKMIVYTPIIVMNTFTPNGDGVNDYWDIPSLAAYPFCSVCIFTRYGKIIYSSVGYTRSWDGTYSGKPAPIGTYYYVIDPKNGSKRISGALTILR